MWSPKNMVVLLCYYFVLGSDDKTTMNSLTKPKIYSPEEKVPFNSRIRDFIKESKKCQTLYSNCEGLHQRRSIDKKDEDRLKVFIYNTIYHDYFRHRETESRKHSFESAHVESLQKKILSLSMKYAQGEKVQFSVVWIYYFDYKLEVQVTAPVFKIFKEKWGNEAVYLDVSLKCYESWDCYLDNAEFPSSFLCLPRNGEYRFDNESGLLDLEFLCSKKLIAQETNSPYKPFSQAAICPWIVTACDICAKLKRFLHCLESEWEKYKIPLLKMIFLVAKTVEFIIDPSFTSFLSCANFGLMMLNSYLSEEPTPQNVLFIDYWLKSLDKAFSPDFVTSDSRQGKEIQEEGNCLFLKSSKEICQEDFRKVLLTLQNVISRFKRDE